MRLAQDKLLNELKQALDNNAEMAVQLQIMVQRTEFAQRELIQLRGSKTGDESSEDIKDKTVLNKYEVRTATQNSDFLIICVLRRSKTAQWASARWLGKHILLNFCMWCF